MNCLILLTGLVTYLLVVPSEGVNLSRRPGRRVGARFEGLQPVNVTFFGESLCPDTIAFIHNQLEPTWEALGQSGDYLVVDYVSYGNARQTYNPSTQQWVFTCQHGPNECLGNLYHTCTINYYKQLRYQWMAILGCYAKAYVDTQPVSKFNVTVASEACERTYFSNVPAIRSCVNGPQGNALEHSNGVRTESLSPPHNYVPWVLINGQHTDAIQKRAESDLLGLVCDQWAPSQRPPSCRTRSPSLRGPSSGKKANSGLSAIFPLLYML